MSLLCGAAQSLGIWGELLLITTEKGETPLLIKTDVQQLAGQSPHAFLL